MITQACYMPVAEIMGDPRALEIGRSATSTVMVPIPRICLNPQIVATFFSTDARFEVQHVKAKLGIVTALGALGGAGVGFAVQYQRAADTGPFLSSIVDCADEHLDERMQNAIGMQTIASATRKILRAFVNLSVVMTVDELHGRVSPLQEQMDYLLHLDKLIWRSSSPLFVAGAILRCEISKEGAST